MTQPMTLYDLNVFNKKKKQKNTVNVAIYLNVVFY